MTFFQPRDAILEESLECLTHRKKKRGGDNERSLTFRKTITIAPKGKKNELNCGRVDLNRVHEEPPHAIASEVYICSLGSFFLEALLQLAATYAQFLSRSRGADWRRRLNLSVCVLLNGSAVLSVEYSSILWCRATVSLKECSTSSRSTQNFNGFLSYRTEPSLCLPDK